MGLLLRINTIAMGILLVGLVIAEYMALRDVHTQVEADMEMTTALTDYLVELQTVALQAEFQQTGMYPSDRAIKRIFDLKRMHNIEHLDVHFISPSGELLDANKPLNIDQSSAIPSWIYDMLANYLYVEPIEKEVKLGGKQLGQIRITHNLNSVINEVWQTSTEVIFPLMLMFLIGSLLIAVLASFIFKPVEKLLKISRQMTENQPVKHRRLAGMTGIITAGTQLDKIGEQLQRYNRQLRQLNEQLLTLHEDERKSISAELHDEIGQHLTAIRFDTATIATAVDLDEAKQAGESIDKINRQLTGIVRSMLKRLRPPSLETAGLAASLIDLVDDSRQRHPGQDIQLRIDGELAGLTDTINLTVYRAVQEALTNSFRHAGDKVTVKIHLLKTPEKVTLTVSDDGYGCDLDEVSDGYGLLAMRERVESLSGEFTVVSSPGTGMKLMLSIPL
ncbi:sensor histidine kinase [Methylophaga sp. OBS3]|uniref:sensor histidine kinase n=1 Tax=Methylophaga sp. OBS3 TaxID=2991934 RepID=UPI00224C9E53|nr:sensor histidine kinase [Methylophaga sp. OBS3]MCX4190794.1 sensor histidine kinase [Methylophaga sp. OBS3]